MRARGRGARNLEIDDAVLDAAFLDEVVVDGREFLIHIGNRNAQLAQGAAAAGQMALQRKAFAVVDPRGFVDAVAELIAAVLKLYFRGI